MRRLQVQHYLFIGIFIIGLMFMPSKIMAQNSATSIYAVAWSPDGSKLAIAGTTGLQVVTVATQEELPGFHVNALPVRAVAWSPDGNRLVSSGASGIIQVWDVASGTLITSLLGHEASVADLAWSSDGNQLASVLDNIDQPTIRTWNMNAYLPIAAFDASALAEVAWTHDGSQVIVANTVGGVYAFDASLPMSNLLGIQEYSIGPLESFGSISLHPNGTILAMGSFHQPVIYLWDIATNQQLDILTGHSAFVLAMDWHPDGNLLASVGIDGTVRLWNITSGQQTVVYRSDSPIYTVEWSPDGQTLAYGGADGFEIAPVISADVVRTTVAECITDRGIRTSLTAKINNAQWGAFINEVEAQRGKKIPEECAVDLISMAQYLLENE